MLASKEVIRGRSSPNVVNPRPSSTCLTAVVEIVKALRMPPALAPDAASVRSMESGSIARDHECHHHCRCVRPHSSSVTSGNDAGGDHRRPDIAHAQVRRDPAAFQALPPPPLARRTFVRRVIPTARQPLQFTSHTYSRTVRLDRFICTSMSTVRFTAHIVWRVGSDFRKKDIYSRGGNAFTVGHKWLP